MAHLAQVREIATPLGIGFLGLGMTPSWSRAQIPVMPKGRYKIMTNYMPKVGQYGLDMMYRTCTVQTNLDFSSEADMVKKLRVSLALQPVATALFANSPFTEGKPNGFLSFRSEIWRDTDNARAGMLPFAFEDGMGFERYVDYALDVPMYFVKRGDDYIDVAGSSFRDFFDGRNNSLPGERPTLSDWANHLSTIFPEVRLKRYLEMRGADGVPWGRLPALPAFWVGLLYDNDSLDAAWDIVKDWNADERQALRDDVPRFGFKARIRDRYLFEIAKECLVLSYSGLRRRGRVDHLGRDESRHLEPLRSHHRFRAHAGRRDAGEIQRRRGTARSSRSIRNMRFTRSGKRLPDQAVPRRSSAVQVAADQMSSPRDARVRALSKALEMRMDRLLRACVVAFALRGGGHIGASGAGAGQFRPSRRRLSERAGVVRRSRRLRADLRTRSPLPRLELQLSERCDEGVGVLAQEQCAGAHPGSLLRLRRPRRRRGRAAQHRDGNLHRPLRRRLQEFRVERARRRRRLQGRLHRRQAMPRLDLRAARLCGQGCVLFPEERHQAAAAEGGVYEWSDGAVMHYSARRR